MRTWSSVGPVSSGSIVSCRVSTHKLQFDHRGSRLPICRECGWEMDLATWLSDEECPGSQACRPPAAHVFLHGRKWCECGMVYMDDLEEL